MFKIFKQWMFARRYKRAVKKAVELSKVFDMRFYVICLNGKLRVVSKQVIELLVARRRFRKGVTVRDIEKKALFVTR